MAARLPSSSVAPSLAPQQSPIFGHRASSQTVCSPRPLKSFLILVNDDPVGIEVLRNEGSRGLNASQELRWSHFPFHQTHCEVFPSTTLSGTLSAIKSSSDGPSSSLLLNVDLDEAGVARYRTWCDDAREATRDDEERRTELTAVRDCAMSIVRGCEQETSAR